MTLTLDGLQDPGPAEAPPAGHALVGLDGGHMGILRQLHTAVAHHWRVARRKARDAAGREGSWVNYLLVSHPPSVRDQAEYLRQRAWVPPGHEGGIADKAGVGYQRAIGIPGVALGNWIAGTAARPFRFIWTAAIVLFAAVVTLALLGQYAAAEWTAGIPAGLTVAWVAAAALWPDRRQGTYLQREAPEGAEEETSS